MIIEFYSKNWALYDERYIEVAHVPRVGELIDTRAIFPKNDTDYFMVVRVNHRATETKLTPVVTCREWHRGHRLALLQEHGWLPGGHLPLVHDDE